MKSLAVLLLIFLVGCSASGPKTAVKTSFVFTDALTATQSQTGGIILYGRNKADFTDSFITIINGDAQQLSLANGDWEFKAVSWDGFNSSLGTYGNPMEGAVRCSYIPSLTLSGSDTDLNLVLSQANCQNSDFGSPDTQGANGPKTAKFYSCSNDEAFNDNGNKSDSVKCFNSIGNSFQVALMGRLPNGAMKEVYSSRCIANDNSATKTMGILDSVNPHELRLPIFFPDYPGPAWKVKVFEDGACTTQNSQSTFVHPYANTIEGRKALFKSDQFLPDNQFIVYTPVCGSVPGTGATPFISHLNYSDQGGTAVNEQYSVICSADQMTSYMTNNPGLSYKLGRNIDFSGTTFTDAIVNTPFYGQFDGSGKTLSNFMINATNAGNGHGLFSELTSGSISNLNVDSVTINCSSTSNTGAVVGSISSGGLLDNVHVSNVNITNTACSNVGGIAGVASGAADMNNLSVDGLLMDVSGEGTGNIGGGFGSIDNSLKNSIFSNITITQSGSPATAVSNYGGVVGSMVSSNGPDFIDISANQINLGTVAQPINNVTAIGGIFGKVSGANTIRSVEVTSNINTGMTSNRVGGIVGEANDNSYSSGVIYNLLSNSNIFAQGDMVGGVLGFSKLNHTVRLLRSFGTLSCISNCGGIVGHADGGTNYSLLYSAMDISPASNGSASNIGGIFGFATSSSGDLTSRAIQNDGTIDFTNTNSAVRVGGAIGYYTGTTQNAINLVINHGNVTGKATVSTVGQVGVGGIFGYMNNDIYLPLSSYLNTGNITNIGTGSAYHFLGGYIDTDNNSYYTAVGGDALYSSGSADGIVSGLSLPTNASISVSNANTVAVLPGFSSFSVEGDGTSPLDLKGIYRLKQIGGQTSLGNRQSPFQISTTAQWNAIEDLDFLMNAHFELAADLDFSGVTFYPIGSSLNPFEGGLRGNGFGLDNITLNHTVTDRVPVGSSATTSAAMSTGSSSLTTNSGGFSSLSPGDKLEIVDQTNGSIYVSVLQVVDDNNLYLSQPIEVGIAANSPIYIAQERNFGIFTATQYANINSSDDKNDYYSSWLYIRNLNINISSTTTSIVDINVGGVVGRSGVGSMQNIKVDGATITVNSSSSDMTRTGGITGYLNLTTDNDNWIDSLEIDNSTIRSSGGGTILAGGLFGYLNSAAIDTSTPASPYHSFRSLKVYNTDITSDGYAGGILANSSVDTFSNISFENLWVTSDQGSAVIGSTGAAGGLFALPYNLEVHTYSISGISVSSTAGSAGGIAGNAGGATFKGGYVSADVSSTSVNAGCFIGVTSSGMVTLQNSYAFCRNVSASTQALTSNAVADPSNLSQTSNDVFYIGAVDSNASSYGMINITEADLYNEAYMNSTYPNFKAIDPWIWPASGYGQPLPYYEVFPKYFFD